MDFFKQLKETSILDDTFIILVGDPGFRIGEYFSTTAGEYEARYGRILSTCKRSLRKPYVTDRNVVCRSIGGMFRYMCLGDLCSRGGILADRHTSLAGRHPRPPPIGRYDSLLQCGLVSIASYWISMSSLNICHPSF